MNNSISVTSINNTKKEMFSVSNIESVIPKLKVLSPSSFLISGLKFSIIGKLMYRRDSNYYQFVSTQVLGKSTREKIYPVMRLEEGIKRVISELTI